MINYLSKSVLSLLIICNLTSCSSKSSGIPNQEISVDEKMLNATPYKPENLNTITCLDCRIEIEDYNMTEFFKNLKSINFDISPIYDEEGDKYYGFKYDLGKNYQAIVFGRNYYEGGIDFYLIVWDNRKRQFISEPQMISGVRGDGGQFEYIESTITDLNGDDIPDLVTNNYIVYQNVDPFELKNDYLEIYTFKDGGFKEAKGTKQQLNIYKTKSFSLPERISKNEIEDVPIDKLEEFCNGTHDLIYCLQQVSDEFNRRLLSKQEELLQSKNQKRHKNIQDKWLEYKLKDFKIIELMFDREGANYPTIRFKTKIVKNRILESDTSSDNKDIEVLRQQLAEAKTKYDVSYNSVMKRDKISNHFGSLFQSANSAWLEYKRLAVLPLDGETENSVLRRHIQLLTNRAEYLTALSDYLSTMK